jgi:hypothetical protein
MRLKAKIINISILRESVSVRLNALNGSGSDVQDLSSLKDRTTEFEINTLKFPAQVKAININNGVGFLLHMSRDTSQVKEAIYRLADLMDHEFVHVSNGNNAGNPPYDRKSGPRATDTGADAGGNQEREVADLLRQVSKKLKQAEEDVLFRLTTFRAKKSGDLVPGRRTITGMSAKSMTVLRDKLIKELAA